MQSFNEAERKLNGRESRKLENNTYVLRTGADSIGVKLHNTVVVEYHRDGRIILNSGGWRSVTTKDRMNKYAPAYVSQRKGVWYLDGGKTEYEDGVNVGVVVNAQIPAIV